METLIAGKSTTFQEGKHVSRDVGGAAGGGTWDSVCLAHLVLAANPLSRSGSSLPTFSVFAVRPIHNTGVMTWSEPTRAFPGIFALFCPLC